MHAKAIEFVTSVAGKHGPWWGKLVLEVGSKNINDPDEAVRAAFAGSEYLGIDQLSGDGVDLEMDWVSRMTWWGKFGEAHQGYYNCVVSTEMLEHCESPSRAVWRMLDCLKPGGLLIITCAGRQRPQHSMYDGGTLNVGEYYANVLPTRLLTNVASECFEFQMAEQNGDLRLWAIKANQ